ncbi:MAG: hypothetical protein PF569_08530 [Candidatus Woesearchaeota archaeon]|jgi:hypothetical protein|nr:hypothetical protein [Candidatus Woesearchaeota archaeon]
MKNKKKAKKLLNSGEEFSFTPKKEGDLKATCFRTTIPIGNGEYHEYLFHCMKWINGEGYDLSIHWSYKNKSKEKRLSLGSEEIEGVLACLNELGFLKE